eukprot:Tbor_TRINITY_DN4448_c0_g1::TRINITY_DN4448_c0_g1_i1::g.7884::m.7884/K04507/CACYBP, SIP; calcyclin binding protein
MSTLEEPQEEINNTPIVDTEAMDAASITSQTEVTTTEKKTTKAKNSYYYWHGHEKERAMVGDVAPLPTPVRVDQRDDTSTHDGAIKSLLLNRITNYSWCDNSKSISIYVDFEGIGDLGEGACSLRVDKRKLSLTVTVPKEINTNNKIKNGEHILELTLFKDVTVPEKNSLKLKPNQIVLKLSKVDEEAKWLELIGNDDKVEDDE